MMKYFVSFVGAVIICLAIIGGYKYPLQQAQTVIAGSPTGTTFNTVKMAAIVFSLTSTSTSILNPFGQAVYVRGPRVACNTVGTSKTAFTGAGLASLTMLIGTSSAALTSASTGLNSAAEVGNLTIATSTGNFLLASSTTDTATSTNAIAWGATEYMSFQTNATNTAICTVGVEILGQ